MEKLSRQGWSKNQLSCSSVGILGLFSGLQSFLLKCVFFRIFPIHVVRKLATFTAVAFLRGSPRRCAGFGAEGCKPIGRTDSGWMLS